MSGRLLTPGNTATPEHSCAIDTDCRSHGALWLCDECGRLWQFIYGGGFSPGGWRKVKPRKARKALAVLAKL